MTAGRIPVLPTISFPVLGANQPFDVRDVQLGISMLQTALVALWASQAAAVLPLTERRHERMMEDGAAMRANA
jgi:hypothetical protein